MEHEGKQLLYIRLLTKKMKMYLIKHKFSLLFTIKDLKLLDSIINLDIEE